MKLNSKEKGMSGIFDMIPVLMMLIIGMIFILNFSEYINYIKKVNEVENIAGKYILIMESTGGLTEEDFIGLQEELNSLGVVVDEKSFEGTTFYDDRIEYGQKLFLEINVMIPVKCSQIDKKFIIRDDVGWRKVCVKRSAIALY